MIGTKAGFWAAEQAGGLGLSAIYYTDFESGAWRLRPEAGIGLSRFKITYGYNIPLTNKSFEKVNRNNICLNILIGIKEVRKR